LEPRQEPNHLPTIAERIQSVQGKIEAAAARSHHGPRPVTLIAVTKHHTAEAVEAVAAAGILDVGENRVQEALEKATRVTAELRWHLIGRLQRNKVRRALELFGTVHAVDSPRLLGAIGATERALDIFLQVNVSGEQSKGGVSPADIADLLREARKWPQLRVLGLMTMAPYDENPEAARPHFRTLRELRDDLNRAGCSPPMECLSMGMSGDYEVAVEEGATHVRIGSAIMADITPPSR